MMRGFLVPFLEFLQKSSEDQTKIDLDLDLNDIYNLADVEAEKDRTDKYNYLKSSFDLSGTASVELSIDGVGTRRPYYSKYKLVHYVTLNLNFDGSKYQLTGGEHAFQTQEKNGRIVVSNTFEESSESPIDEDTGPSLAEFSEQLNAMKKVVQKKEV
jgi:hypothetical protein